MGHLGFVVDNFLHSSIAPFTKTESLSRCLLPPAPVSLFVVLLGCLGPLYLVLRWGETEETQDVAGGHRGETRGRQGTVSRVGQGDKEL